MAIQTKEIGIDLGIGIGTYFNTEYVNGKLRLKLETQNNDGENIYFSEGYWESEVIDLVDKFTDYDKVVLNKTQYLADTYVIKTRTSDDNITWDEYIPTAIDGKIQSETRRYIQVKIELYAGYQDGIQTISEFNVGNEETLTNSEFIETNGQLRLKKNYEFNMDRDVNWADEGNVFIKTITKSDFKKIDRIDVITP